MKTSAFLFAGMIALVMLPQAEGSPIITLGGGTNTPGTGPQENGEISSDDVTGTMVTGTATAFAKSEGFATASEQRFFDWDFFASSSGSDTIYDFEVTIVNEVGLGDEVPTQSASAGDDIQNIDFGLVGPIGMGGVGTLDFESPANSPPGGPIIFERTVGLTTERVLRFGGLNGGGPAIASNGTRTFNFQVRVPGTGSNFQWQLRITANPEPGTMFLAAMAVSLIAGGYTLRRRRLNVLQSFA